MSNKLAIQYSTDVRAAQAAKQAVVALESTVISHGLPYPQNLELAQDMEAVIRDAGAVPATSAVIDGKLRLGLNADELERLASEKDLRKISVRDFGAAVAQRASGGTTVAGTLIMAERAGVQVFATGGIGGVHQGSGKDISTDLLQLSRSPVIVVCAGAKAILDLPATIEYLETMGVPVVGFQTDEFPAFYSRESGLSVSARAEKPEEIAHIAKSQWSLGIHSAILVGNPPPAEVALPAEEINTHIEMALKEAEEQGIHGQAVTPFLLARVSELSDGESLKTNLALLKNNASLAAKTAVAMQASGNQVHL
ncbi:MAG: pseudouridine-5'-phosphate glycosidase [Chloroflexi bacterium]|nr:MAG: pseudouridine-5'-phosphate glycosidase [Chloroflexota bacterium]MBL1194213.1 pseudouridine-5'-phosphate glycosidase [Chloroflexota bacterium]NOH11506.1 pseudouridine-5'-phosphate glycosidase [Chloroflexota bacterium]